MGLLFIYVISVCLCARVCACVLVHAPSALFWILWGGGMGVTGGGINEEKDSTFAFKGLTLKMWIKVEF